MSKKVIVIGGGPGGYVAAIRAAQLGASVELIEADKVGGTCLNVGCIPTKTLLHTAEVYREVVKGSQLGIKADNVSIDWTALQKRKAMVVNRLVKGVETLLKANKIHVRYGKASLLDAKTVAVGDENLTGDAIVLATGSEPVRLSFPGSHLAKVVDSTAALNLPAVPKSLVIVGGGVIGVEFAALYNALGSEVTVVELLPEILPTIDSELAVKLRSDLSRQGVTFLTGAKLNGVEESEAALTATVAIGDKIEQISAEYVLVAVGRKARLEELGLEKAGVATERGRIVVDDTFTTSVPGIYAVGDCNGLIMLAHAASAQGVAAVEHALGHKAAYYGHTIPACIYTMPEVSSVGFTEDDLKKREVNYTAGVFPLIGNGKALIEGGQTGLVKIVADSETGKVLGVHIIGPRATDLIAEGALALKMGANVEDILTTIHAHPTVSEAMAEAALATRGMAIHLPPGKI